MNEKFSQNITKIAFVIQFNITTTISLQINFLLFRFRVFYMQAFCLAKKGLAHKETPVVIEIVIFPIESLVFQNRLLTGAHSISDITSLIWWSDDSALKSGLLGRFNCQANI